MSEKFVENPPAGAEGWREVWRANLRYRGTRFGLKPLLLRLFRGAVEPDAARQADFNLVVLDLLDDLRRDVAGLAQKTQADLERATAEIQRDIRTADDVLARDVARAHDSIPVVARRNDALFAALDQKIETVAVRLRDLTNAPSTAPSTTAHAPDYIYRRLEDGLRGSEAEIAAAIGPYAELARDHQPLLDVGFGRGELLRACRVAGIAARGFDTNERSVADAKRDGLEVAVAAIPECFASIAAGSLGSIAALHVVEHLPIEALFALFTEAARTLRSGGLLMIETPNAESILMSASQFWRDPTHLAPRHPAALVLLGREHGFVVVEALAVHDFPAGTALHIGESDPPELRRVVEAINAKLFAPQDFRLILRKP